MKRAVTLNCESPTNETVEDFQEIFDSFSNSEGQYIDYFYIIDDNRTAYYKVIRYDTTSSNHGNIIKVALDREMIDELQEWDVISQKQRNNKK